MPIVVVGAGASGLLCTHALLRAHCRQPIVLIERDAAWRTGPAYATDDPQHLLNVPAGRLSVDPDRPTDFADWAARRLPAVTPASFLPRRLYGEYLRCAIERAAASTSGAGLTRVTAEVSRVRRGGASRSAVFVDLDGGRSIRCAHVVLALGNPPARPLAGDSARIVQDPWAPGWRERVGPTDSVVLVGSGLTAVDVAISLAAGAPNRSITMISRRGLLPRSHATGPIAPTDDIRFAAPTARAVVAAIRSAIVDGDGDWRTVFDALRRDANDIWAMLPELERKRLLRHAHRYWEVHRHRMAPDIARHIDDLVATRRVEISRGAVVRVDAAADSTGRVVIRRSNADESTVSADWVVNCTGPRFDLQASKPGIISRLFDAGLARPGPLGLGLDVTGAGQLVDAHGHGSASVSVVGPLRRGVEWETTAIPEIRAQAGRVATRLAHERRRVDTGTAHRHGRSRVPATAPVAEVLS